MTDVEQIPREKGPTVFISHSRRTEPLAIELAQYLRASGLESWLPKEELRPGREWESAVSQALDNADGLVLIVEPDSPSESMRREWSMALESWWGEEDHKLLLPIFIGDAEVPAFLKRIEGIRLPASSVGAEEQFSQIAQRLLRLPSDNQEVDATPDDPELEQLIVRLGSAIDALSQDEADEELLKDNRRALLAELEIYLEQPEPSAESLLPAWQALSLMDRRLGDHELSRQHIEAAIAAQEEIDPDHPRLPQLLFSLGRIHLQLNEPQAAIPILQRGIALQRDISPDDSATIAGGLQSLGNAFLQTGDLPEARSVLEEALQINERELGLRHPSVAGTAFLLGAALQDLEEFDAAKSLYERFLGSREEFDQDDPDAVANLSYGLGRALRELGNPSGSRDLLQNALKLNLARFDGGDFRIGASHYELGRALDDLGELESAIAEYRSALGIFRELGKDESVATTLRDLGAALRRVGDFADSIEALKDALSAAASAFGEKHTSRAELLYSLGLSLRESGDGEKAKECFQEALNIGLDIHGEGHSHVEKYRRALNRRPDPANTD